MEPVSAHQRDNGIDGGAACVKGASPDERFAHQQKVVLELRRLSVCGGICVCPARVARGSKSPRRGDPRRHQRQLEAHRLVGVPEPVGLAHFGEEPAVRLDRRAQLVGGGRDGLRHRQPLDQSGKGARVTAEHGIAGATRGGDGDVGSNEGIAVAVASHPVTELERHDLLHGLGGDAELLLEGAHERVAGAPTRVEQARFQVPEHRAHLVHHRRSVLTHLAGDPEQLHLAVELFFHCGTLGDRHTLAREQKLGDAGLEREQRAARGLGGVGGEDGANVEREQRALDLSGLMTSIS